MPTGGVSIFDGASNTWSEAASLPTPRAGLAAVTSTDGHILAIGGRDADGPTDTVESYDPASDTWSSGTPLPKPMADPRAARGADGRIYVLNGATLAIYAPDSRSWSTDQAPPAPVVAPVLTALPDGRLLAAGGSGTTGGLTAASSSVYAYTPGAAGSSGSWEQLADLPVGVTGAAGATGPDGRVYVVGGRTDMGETTGDVQIYSPADDQWTSGPVGSASNRADGSAATGGDGRLYLLGGTSEQGRQLDTVATLSG